MSEKDQKQAHYITIGPTRTGMSTPEEYGTCEHEASEADIHQAYIDQWDDYYEFTGMADLARELWDEEQKTVKNGSDT